MYRRLFFLFVLVLMAFNLSAQTISSDAIFTHYTSNDGLSQLVVRAIIQDKDGFIWVGTEDGLNKFDGYDFKIYRNIRNDKTSLPDNFVYALCPASDGGVWIGTNSGGLAKYNVAADNFTSYQNIPFDESSLSNNRVESVFEDSLGMVWVGTDGGGLCLLNPETGKMVRYMLDDTNPTSISSNSIIGTLEDKNGGIWVRTRSDIEFFDKENESFTPLQIPLVDWNSPSDMSGSFYIDSDGFIWTTIGNALVKVNPSTKEFEVIHFSNFPEEQISLIDIYPLNDQYLWLSDYNGVFLFNKQDYSVQYFSNDEKRPNSIAFGGCLAIMQDRTGSLWVGINSKGISKLNINRKKFTHFKHDPNRVSTIGGSVIKALLVDSEKNIWASVESKLEKLIYSEYGYETYARDTSSKYSNLFTVLPNCFLEDSYGNIWIGSWGEGIKILPGGELEGMIELQSDGTQASVLDDIIQAFHEDKFGNVWIGTELGLCLYNPITGQFRNFLHDPVNVNSPAPYGVQANCIVEDAFGSIWVGTWGGLTRIIPDDITENTFDANYSFVRYLNDPDNNNTISDNRIISLQYDKKFNSNEIYAGTYGTGLNRIIFDELDIENNEVKIYTRFEGMPNDVVYGILYDNNGELWLSTNEGLANFNPKAEEFIIYDVNDGLQANQFYWGARAKGNDGELLFGGINGFNMFYPEEIVSDQTIPSVVFTDLKVLNQSVKVGEKINKNVILKKGINKSDRISLSHHENVFTIEFAGLHFAYPNNNAYRYMLEGFDDEWIEVDSRKRFASYTNLDHGTYTFKVDAANYDGVWTDHPRELTIRIKPPFWKRWWFRIFVLLIVSLIAYEVYRRRMEMLKHDKEVLEIKIKEGEKIIDEKVKEVEVQQEAIRKRDIEEEEMRFTNIGIAKFSDILSSGEDNLKELSQTIISEMVKYVGGVMGVVYIAEEEDKEPVLELFGTYAVDKETLEKTRVKVGEGYVGTCLSEASTITIKNIPEDYSKLTSGLGELLPKTICLVPIKQRDNIQGVIEVAFLTDVEDYKVKFIEKIGENITSVITIKKASGKMNGLLEQSQQQAEELRAQEEEMRQNLEEMYATQEEMKRQIEEQEELQEELNMAKTLLDALMNNLPESVYFKDLKSKFIRISKSMLPLFPFDTIEEMIGKSDYDFHEKEAADEFYDEEQKIIKTGESIIDKEVHEITQNKLDHHVSVTKLPLLDRKGKVMGTFGITKDISERKKYELLSDNLKKELKELKDKNR